MTKNSKLSKEDQKWILFNQKMARMSGKKKTSKDFLDAIKQAHDETYNSYHKSRRYRAFFML